MAAGRAPRGVVWAAAVCVLAATAAARPAGPLLEEVVSRVPPLKHSASNRWPMVTWQPFVSAADEGAFARGEPLSAAWYGELARRGLAQAVRFDERYIAMALEIQRMGSRVIVVQGAGGAGPGAVAPGALHVLDARFELKGRPSACPLLFEGWHTHALGTRDLLRRFRAAGVTLDGVWMDWETQPWGTEDQWEQARHCSRCRDLFPPGILGSAAAYGDFIGRLRQQLYSTYLAAPVREVFPKALVTNWGVIYSTPEVPAQSYWGNGWRSPRSAGLFTALNPVAYGNDVIYTNCWSAAWPDPAGTPLDTNHMDRLYTRIMLAQFSQNQANAMRWAPEQLCVPWVCRYCPDLRDPRVPVLSAARYREILRHLWLRGADSMQVFNAYREERPGSMIDEIADAVAVYDEVLAFRDLLDRGEVMNTAVPAVVDDGAIWSGLRLPTQVVVRAFTQGPHAAAFTVRPWPAGPSFDLEAPPGGAYFILAPDGSRTRG